MVTDAVRADVDSDGDKDLVVVGDWMGINRCGNNSLQAVQKVDYCTK